MYFRTGNLVFCNQSTLLNFSWVQLGYFVHHCYIAFYLSTVYLWNWYINAQCIFTIAVSFKFIVSFINMQWPSLSFEANFILNCTLPATIRAMLTYFWILFTWNLVSILSLCGWGCVCVPVVSCPVTSWLVSVRQCLPLNQELNWWLAISRFPFHLFHRKSYRHVWPCPSIFLCGFWGFDFVM